MTTHPCSCCGEFSPAAAAAAAAPPWLFALASELRSGRAWAARPMDLTGRSRRSKRNICTRPSLLAVRMSPPAVTAAHLMSNCWAREDERDEDWSLLTLPALGDKGDGGKESERRGAHNK